MPYKDKEAQREANKSAAKRYRIKKKMEAEATGRKFEETIPETPENLNFGMEPTREKPLSWDEYLAENPKADKTEWVQYKIKFYYEHKWRNEQERENRKKAIAEREKYGTNQHDCILWRRQFTKGQRSDFFYNHNSSCMPCSRWYEKQKDTSSLDLNATGKKSEGFEELDGYAEAFKEPEPFPEDFLHTPMGTFVLNRCCGTCGMPLKANGKCPVCDQPD